MPKYKNAAEVLPPRLLQEIQRYVEGVQIYIPISGEPKGWGECSGTRAELARRNREILQRYHAGESIEALTQEYYLCHDTIRKIVQNAHEEQGSLIGA